jgi:hypothetical protein
MDHAIDLARKRGETQIQEANQEMYRNRMAQQQQQGAPRLLGANKPKVRQDLLFEDFDGEQERDELEIEGNLLKAAQNLRQTAELNLAMNHELEFHNKLIVQMGEQVSNSQNEQEGDRVTDRLLTKSIL